MIFAVFLMQCWLKFTVKPTSVDVDDHTLHLEYKSFVKFIYGDIVGDKGYISRILFERLFVDGIQLIIKLKSNIEGALMTLSVGAQFWRIPYFSSSTSKMSVCSRHWDRPHHCNEWKAIQNLHCCTSYLTLMFTERR